MHGLGAPALPDLTLTVSPFSSAVVAIGHDDLMSPGWHGRRRSPPFDFARPDAEKAEARTITNESDRRRLSGRWMLSGCSHIDRRQVQGQLRPWVPFVLGPSVEPEGAVLVCPNCHVAWRACTAGGDRPAAEHELHTVVDRILCRLAAAGQRSAQLAAQ